MASAAESRPPRAVVLLSGGMDSATLLAVAKADGFEVFALTIRYGQRHAVEVEAARRIAREWGVADHAVLDLDLRRFGGSALTDAIEVPKDRWPGDGEADIPVTYVPARNTIFLGLALAWAEVLHAGDIFLGVNAVDYSGYPDCRPAFIEAFEHLATLATKAGVEGEICPRVRTPLIDLTKAQIISRGESLGVDYGMTVSCYDPGARGEACGRCDACRLRQRGFREAGVPDPTRYRTYVDS